MAQLTENEKRAQELIVGEVNKALDALEKHFKKFCDDTKGTSIPMVYIEQSFKIYRENYNKAVKK